MNAVDTVRYHMQKVAARKEVLKQQHTKSKQKSASNTYKEEHPDEQRFVSLESKFLDTFHATNSLANILNIHKYIFADVPSCHNVLVLRIMDEFKAFRLYCRGTTVCEHYESYKLSDFECVREILKSGREPVVHSDETSRLLNILVQWRPLFGSIPDYVVGIPIVYADGNTRAVVAISFKLKIPQGFFEKKLPQLMDTLGLIVPYALVNQGTTDSEDAVSSYSRVLESIERVEKAIFQSTAELGLTQLGIELAHLVQCKNLTVFIIDEADRILRKYHTSFGHPGRASCPNKKIHALPEILMQEECVAPLTWVATKKKGMRINQLADLTEFGITAKQIHSIGNCNTKSLIVAPVIDYSGESALVIELADKDKHFSHKEFEMALLFCQHTACLLTCTVLLDRRERNFRRRNIINEMLCSITFVKHATVEQFITHHRKTSNVFRGHFDEFDLCIRCFPEQDISGIALEIFYELGIVRDFKLRRSILIRFIMSVQQGYGPLPYHNWNHAVSVAHFAYLLVRNLKLIEQDHLNKLEAFALIVSALTHDIDHRGTNNQFQACTNSDIFKLYACEDSVMERHHLAIALAILHREDCNILESFNDTDYKYFVELLTWNIIATDVTKHMKTRETLFKDAKSSNPKQRKMAKLSLFMTAADLCDNCKKWDENLPTVKGILQEFFNQGDMERQLGLQPVPQMDRNVAYIPLIEYKFLKFVVMPVYKYLSEMYGELNECYENIKHAEELWTRATVVYDKYKNKDPLDVLDLPDMKESKLMKLTLDDTVDEVKHNRFSIQPQQSPSTTGSTPSQPVPPSCKKCTQLVLPSQDKCEDVDTGENHNNKLMCCWCWRKKKTDESNQVS